MRDPRLIEIDFLADLDSLVYRQVPKLYQRPGTMDGDARHVDDAIFHLILDGAAISDEGYAVFSNLRDPRYSLFNQSPSHPLDMAVKRTALAFQDGKALKLQITQRGRLRLYRLRDELLNTNRVRDSFDILWDKRHWQTDLDVRLKFLQPESKLSILIMDVDRFKLLNTKLGHFGADDVLRSIFVTLRDGAHPGDAYRLGGDEAGAILPGIAESEAVAIGERIRDSVAREHADRTIDESGASPTVTIAVGQYDGSMSARDFIQSVDQMLVEVKDKGGHRNVVVSSAGISRGRA